MTLRFCANLKWLFTEVGFEARFAAAAEAGFTAIEYSQPYDHSARELRKYLSDNGLRQILINTPVDPAASAGIGCWPGAEPDFRDGLRHALDYAVELNCSLVHVMAGCPPAEVSRDRALSTFEENLGWAVSQAKGSGVRLLVEAQNPVDRPGYLISRQDDAAAVVQAVDPAGLGVLFDVYHCAMGQADVDSTLAAVMPLVAHVQVADLPRRSEPESGTIRWDSVFELLEASYRGWIGCEYTPLTTTVAGLGWMARRNPRRGQ